MHLVGVVSLVPFPSSCLSLVYCTWLFVVFYGKLSGGICLAILEKIAIGTVLVRVCLLWEVFSSLEHLLSITIIGPFD